MKIYAQEVLMDMYCLSIVARNKPILLYPFSLIHKQPNEQHETPLTARLLLMQDTPESEACILSCLWRTGLSAQSQTLGPFIAPTLAFPGAVCISVKQQTVRVSLRQLALSQTVLQPGL